MSEVPNIECVIEPAFGENAYVVWVSQGGPCWIVDPGLPPSAGQLLRHVERRHLRLEAIILTHAHADHIAGIPEVLAAHADLPVYLANVEAAYLSDPYENLSAAFGAAITAEVGHRHDLPPGAELILDGAVWQVLDTSGHSPGGRSLYCGPGGVVLAGDALFAGSIGRTDFPHSDHSRLIRNIRQHLLVMPDATRVFSGHGPQTTIGQERHTNPFLVEGMAASTPDMF